MGEADLGVALTANKDHGTDLAVGSDSGIDLEFDEAPDVDPEPELDPELDDELDADLEASMVYVEWHSVTWGCHGSAG